MTAHGMALRLALALVGVAAGLAHGKEERAGRLNVLLIAIDDLKPDLGVYGEELAKTPRLDALLGRGVTFMNMQACKSECAPSRTCMLSGMRPDRNRVWGFEPDFRKHNPNAVTLPGLFREAGYAVEAVGKLFDGRSFFEARGGGPGKTPSRSARPLPDLCDPDRPGRACSWDRGVTLPQIQRNVNEVCGKDAVVEFFPGDGGDPLVRHRHLVFEYPNALKGRDQDACVARVARARLRALAGKPKPFFLAVGFASPHMPWTFQKRLGRKFQRVSTAALRASLDEDRPTFWRDHGPQWARYSGQEMKRYDGWQDVSEEDRIRGYFAAVTKVDRLVGKIVGTLEGSPAANDTIIVVWGDHGFHLGDNDLWGKKTTLEQATRVPFGIVLPPAYLAANPGVQTGTKVESVADAVDIYPTIAGLCGLQVPAELRGGTSLVPLLFNPRGHVRAAAVSQYQSQRSNSWIGYSIRTLHHRYVVYLKRVSRFASLGEPLAVNKNNVGQQRLYHYAAAGDIERVDRLNDPAFADAASAFQQLLDGLQDRDWSHLVGQAPFDQQAPGGDERRA